MIVGRIASPMTIAYHSEKADKVAGGAQPAETVVTEWLRDLIVLGGAEAKIAKVDMCRSCFTT